MLLLNERGELVADCGRMDLVTADETEVLENEGRVVLGNENCRGQGKLSKIVHGRRKMCGLQYVLPHMPRLQNREMLH